MTLNALSLFDLDVVLFENIILATYEEELRKADWPPQISHSCSRSWTIHADFARNLPTSTISPSLTSSSMTSSPPPPGRASARPDCGQVCRSIHEPDILALTGCNETAARSHSRPALSAGPCAKGNTTDRGVSWGRPAAVLERHRATTSPAGGDSMEQPGLLHPFESGSSRYPGDKRRGGVPCFLRVPR
ncbi:hypothetical protein PG994_003161 [Apiospora phragmitis]|uniref:Uncharacterized protein n=1 Tax=Apiospora phragmitis TaxID=2905665 RepID=A0ABR1WAZ2_9PEZI